MNDNIVTYTGVRYSLLNPRTEDVRLEDVAHHPSNTCRYTGAVRKFYSVAQHSWHVSFLCHPDYALEGLMHDSPEAYITDVSGPLKHTSIMSGYRDLEEVHYGVICSALDISTYRHPSIKEADLRMYFTEVRDLMPPHPEWEITTNEGTAAKSNPYEFTINPVPPEVAERLFLARYHELKNRR